jgi:alkylated DNA repair dioxygenase AlkB
MTISIRDGARGCGSPLPLPGADIRFDDAFLGREDADRYFTTLLTEIAWRESEVFVWGKWRKQPRLVAWYGDAGAVYSYSGTTMQPQPWGQTLQRLRERVESAAGAPFNSVLLNLYRNENDSMGFHSDDEPELGPEPLIASVNLGEQRDFLLKHRRDKTLGTRHLALTHGSLLLMAGQTQHNWHHGVSKEKKPAGQRINLTFRRIWK